MKKVLGFFIIIGILLVLGYAFRMFKSKSEPDLYVVNVLDSNLYGDCHIKGSINVPFGEHEEWAKKLDKNSHIVFYCSNYMCTASGQAAKDLKKLGFNNVWAYEAGMADWFQNKLPVEGSCKEAYLNMQMNKPEIDQQDGVQHITTQDLHNKMKKMLNI
jgi:rhodanese-related sulfurtransferase